VSLEAGAGEVLPEKSQELPAGQMQIGIRFIQIG